MVSRRIPPSVTPRTALGATAADLSRAGHMLTGARDGGFLHNCRTPITIARGYLALLLEERYGPLTDRQRRALQVVLTQTDRLNSLLESGPETGDIQEGASGRRRAA